MSLDVVEEQFRFGDLAVAVTRPANPGDLIDEARFATEEYMPYWAELWPAGVELAQFVSRLEVRGLTVLELGCGLGLPSIVAALRGARVTATDWSPEAVEMLQANAARNRATLEARTFDWQQADALVGAPYDLVLAADVLYEERNATPLIRLLDAALADTGAAFICDPGRRYAVDFPALAADVGLCSEELHHGLETQGGRLFRLHRGPAPVGVVPPGPR